VSSPNQPPDPPITLEGIGKDVSELAGKIDSLTATYSDLPAKLAADQKGFLETVKAKSQSNKPVWIAAGASIAAALIGVFNGWNTSQTNAALTRYTTMQSENTKRGLDFYYEAQGKIASLEQGFETFLLQKKLPQKVAQLGNDLDGMSKAGRFEPKTAVIKDYYDFIFETIDRLQHNPERWKDVDVEALRKEVQDKCQKAIQALDDLEQGK
jgi:hypothetical protein